MTPAVTALDRAGVAHQLHRYDHDPSAEAYGAEAAEVLGLDPAMVFKTLVVVDEAGRHLVGVVPVSGRLDLKALARAAGAKKVTMADPARAEKLTGYVVGGISPLGHKQRLAVFVDISAQGLEAMWVSGGRRGLEIELAPGDLVATAGASYAPISG